MNPTDDAINIHTKLVKIMKTHIVIPARLKSTRLPNKPLLPIAGIPMIVWTANRAKQAITEGIADDFWVATDDTAIDELCQRHNIPTVMTKDSHLSGTDRLSEVADLLAFADEDIVINLQGDEPLMPSILLSKLKNLLIQKPDCSMATLCEPIGSIEEWQSPSVVKVAIANNQALYFSRSPIPYNRQNPDDFGGAYRHLGLYAYRAAMLFQFATWQAGMLESLESLEQLRVLENGLSIAIDVVGCSVPLGVDTQADLDRLNQLSLDELHRYCW